MLSAMASTVPGSPSIIFMRGRRSSLARRACSPTSRRTSTIRLGTGVITLADGKCPAGRRRCAVLDLISNSRLEIGFGTGGNRSESFEAFGVDPDRSGDEIYARAINRAECLTRSLAAASGGETCSIRRPARWSTRVAGDVLGAGRAPCRLERGWPDAVAHAAAARPKSLHGPLSEIQNEIIDAYLSGLPQGQAPRILGSRSLFVAEDRKEALSLAETGLRRVVPTALSQQATGSLATRSKT
jgi:alkanesulfonate monooxygenase SsuD/methylene tetrahydromethanopterin reductase-like flavin-dependent oxidoreductase (luciferase family)